MPVGSLLPTAVFTGPADAGVLVVSSVLRLESASCSGDSRLFSVLPLSPHPLLLLPWISLCAPLGMNLSHGGPN